MSLTEARFHALVDALQLAVEDAFDASGLDVDLENSGGVLTVRFDNGSQLIFSRQEPLRLYDTIVLLQPALRPPAPR